MEGEATPEDSTDFNALLDSYSTPVICRPGDILEGTVVTASRSVILIDVGGKCDALVHPQEVERLSAIELRRLRPGGRVRVYVLDAEVEEGEPLIVSLRKAAQQSQWEQARRLMERGETLRLEVKASNKGGVIVFLDRLRGFVPASQLHPRWRSRQQVDGDPERRWSALIGQVLALKIIEVTPESNRLILSERRVNDGEQDKQRVLASLKPGMVRHGVVSNVVDFGAFVNVDGVDGLLHISELSWRRVRNPSEIVHVGQELEVYVLDVDLERGRLSLSLKRLQPDPWANLPPAIAVGALVEAEIVSLVPFGAFARPLVYPQIEGLIHRSEMGQEAMSRLRKGMVLTLRIIGLDRDRRRIAFSIKQVEDWKPPTAG